MNSRMEKYENNENQVTSRTEKNKKLYNDTNIDRIDVGYIDIDKSNVFEIPLAKEKDIKTREDYKKMKELSYIIGGEKETDDVQETLPKEEKRIYDINEILKKAKEELKEDEEKTRLLNTEYNILTKLDLANIEKISSSDIKEEDYKKIINEIYPKMTKEKETDDKEDLFKDLEESKIYDKAPLDEEQEESKYIKTIYKRLNLQNEIKDDENNKEAKENIDLKKDEEKTKEYVKEEVITEDEDEKEKQELKETERLVKQITDTNYDTSFMQIEKGGKGKTILIIIIILLLISLGGYVLLKYFGKI